MLNRFTTAFGKAVSLLMLIVVISSQAKAQTTIGRQKVDQYPCTSWNMMTYGLTWLPTDYTTNTTQKYPLIIFLHGKGETGDGIGGLYSLTNTALPMFIANGWDPVAVNPVDGQTYKFIVVSPQAPVASQWSYTWDNIQYILQDVITRYRVDLSRIYVTGLSAGGNGTWTCLTNGAAAAKKFAAAAPIASAAVALDEISKVGSLYGVKLWQVCGDQDPFITFTNQSTGLYNSTSPSPMALVTSMPGQGHWASVWNTAYDPNWRSNLHNKNMYEWMLQYKRTDVSGGGGSNPPPNQAPTANAGADQMITLPVNSVSLSGSATDADGSISSYSWTKVAGPGAGTISSASSASTQATGLVEGSYTFRLTATDNAGATNFDEVTVTVNSAASQQPSNSIKIEAESFASMFGIGTENTSDAGGGLNIGWQDNGDWMNYSVNLSNAGTYTVNFRVASYFSGAQFQMKKADGTVLSTVTVPNTGSFQTWQTVSAQVTLPAGQQTLRIFTSAANGGWNFNWWEIAGGSSSSNPPPSSTTVKIEAESFSAMSGIGTENTSDAGGGLNIGWQDNNDWMDYSVNLSAAGTYTVNFRVASYFSGAQFQLKKSDGTVLTTVTVPNTGSFQTWQTVSAQVSLPAGQQTLRIFTSSANGGWNFNWWEIAGASSSTPPPSTSAKIEAESFSAMSGIGTENTSDAGGGLNVGWQDNNDWMDYVVNASAAGSYTVNFRVASYFSGATFQLRKSDGTVLATVTVPNTGSFQTWQTVSASVNLPAGQQTLRIVTTNANGGWNINWWEITSGTASKGTEAAGTVHQVMTTTATTTTAAMQLFPNLISDRFMLKVNNAMTGKMKVEIYDMKGALVKQFSVSKAAGISQSYLSIGDLQPGQYILKASMNNYSETKQLIKQ